MAKATAQSTTRPHCSESQSELAETAETATLPQLPDVADVSGKAANDTAFAVSDNATNECLERLIKLAESIDERLERIAEAIAAGQPPSPQTKKKRSRAKK